MGMGRAAEGTEIIECPNAASRRPGEPETGIRVNRSQYCLCMNFAAWKRGPLFFPLSFLGRVLINRDCSAASLANRSALNGSVFSDLAWERTSIIHDQSDVFSDGYTRVRKLNEDQVSIMFDVEFALRGRVRCPRQLRPSQLGPISPCSNCAANMPSGRAAPAGGRGWSCASTTAGRRRRAPGRRRRRAEPRRSERIIRASVPRRVTFKYRVEVGDVCDARRWRAVRPHPSRP